MNARAGFLKNQNEIVVTFTLVEFLTALVFVAMALAVVLKSEALRDLNPTQENMRRLRDTVERQRVRISRLESDNAFLRQELAEQDSLIRRLMGDRNVPLPPGDTVVSRAYLDNLRGDAAISQERAVNIAGLEAQIRALRGGATLRLPRCPTNTGDLFTIRLHVNGTLSTRPAWRSEFAARVARVPGVGELSSGRPMSVAEFGRLADRVEQWSQAQDPQCRFWVSVETAHEVLRTQRRQAGAIWERFNVSRDRLIT